MGGAVIVGPGDEKAAAAVANRQPRASRADRRESADVLKAAFALGWLAKDEFDTRIGLVTPAILAAAFVFASLRGDGRYEVTAFAIAFVFFVFWLSAGADMLWEWHCTSLPAARVCVRCAHTAASHRAPASCAVRPGSLNRWKRCPCAGYVPPGLSPQTVD